MARLGRLPALRFLLARAAGTASGLASGCVCGRLQHSMCSALPTDLLSLSGSALD